MIILLFSFFALQLTENLSDFSNTEEFKNWRIVNDGVMGGKSNGQFIRSEEGFAIFQGDVSLKNNGGFTSVRNSFDSKDISGSKRVMVKLKGDGKTYQFRIRRESGDYYVYKFAFETSGKWETITIPLNKVTPTFRGYEPNVPAYDGKQLSEIGFLIANKKNESFKLEVSKIWLEK
ncbi:MAG: hypothetical protein BM555_06790 [Crocinitomix sp. MedPE-SWsnd]|nr:MAG: hypothetical protein BM555_06790 [Crocinitomix sp. MedPE-SWsnd]